MAANDLMKENAFHVYEFAQDLEADIPVPAINYFCANLKAGAAIYPGCQHLDWEGLGSQWNALSPLERGKQKAMLDKVLQRNRNTLPQLFQAGDLAAFNEALEKCYEFENNIPGYMK